MKHYSGPLARLALGILFWAPLLLAFWWYGAMPWLIAGLRSLTEPVLVGWFPHELLGLQPASERVWLVKTLLVPSENPGGFAAFQLPVARFTVSFPLFWALALATPAPWRQRLFNLGIGSIGITLLVILMLVLYVQFNLALQINHQALFGEMPPTDYVYALPYSATGFYLSGVGRQLAVLVLPTFSPVVLWGLLNPSLFRFLLVEGVIQRQVQS